MPHSRHGFTILELIIVCVLVAVLTGLAVPRAARFLNGIAVHGAVGDAEALFSRARSTAIARSSQAVIEIDTGTAQLTLRTGKDILRRRDLRALYDVQIASSRSAVVYAPTGIGFGVVNLTLTVSKGTASETLYVSRLGRIRNSY